MINNLSLCYLIKLLRVFDNFHGVSHPKRMAHPKKQSTIVYVSDCVSKTTAQKASDDCNQNWGSGSGGWCCASCGSAGWGTCL